MTVTTFPGIAIPGPTFDTVTPGSISTGFLVGGQLTRSSAHDCFFVDSTGVTAPAVQLPGNSEVGDVVEIYFDYTVAGIAVYAPSGETFGGAVDPVNGNAITLGGASMRGAFFRKLTSTFWGVI